MRPLRNDGGQGSFFIWSEVPPYHREWTKLFIKMVRNLYPGSIIYFNDPKILDDSDFKAFVMFDNGHDNHLHVIFPGGERDSLNENKR
jgi:hypothetical protein